MKNFTIRKIPTHRHYEHTPAYPAVYPEQNDRGLHAAAFSLSKAGGVALVHLQKYMNDLQQLSATVTFKPAISQ